MIFVRCIGNEVNLPKELLLMMLKFTHHRIYLGKEISSENLFSKGYKVVAEKLFEIQEN